MSNIKQEIRAGFIIGVTFLITIFSGGIIYAAITLTAISDEPLSADKWNNMISTLTTPTGAIMAFNLATCPTGWIAANGTNNPLDLRGAFLRGIGGNANSRDVVRTLGDYQADDFASHSHGGVPGKITDAYAGHTLYTAGRLTERTLGYNTSATGGTETRPKNIAVLFCIKQ